MVLCPECETAIDVDPEEVDEGEIVTCVECGADFEVVTNNPLELKRVGDDDDDEAKLVEEDENGDY